eukprot:1296212-Rhodomonas_salina.1
MNKHKQTYLGYELAVLREPMGTLTVNSLDECFVLALRPRPAQPEVPLRSTHRNPARRRILGAKAHVHTHKGDEANTSHITYLRDAVVVGARVVEDLDFIFRISV